ncbi:hypothetical protein FCL49_09385 [Serratia proteamaculans]|uniref:hypothetical protein n=1 Tax=Serratia proteamaculans TaxID=28151 RepID=UPI0015757DCF|nr:hypothetical protein [Serratia proteamaculans]NTX77449.1 hypothetical protein [Serratia proteamaculans]NTZ28308.1 hypothetical protein [Serratia proteamaculans]
MKTKIFISILLLSLLAMPLSLYLLSYFKSNHFTCRAKTYIYRGDVRYFTLMKFDFNGGTGHFSSVSEYHDGKVSLPRININFDFSYSKNDAGVLLLSSNSTLAPSIAKQLRPIMADFFIYPQRGYQVRVEKFYDDGYVFIEGDLPAFVCIKE